MPWNGTGNFSRTNGVNTGTDVWQDDAATVETILADRHDVHDQDIADGLNNVLTKDGQSWPPTTDLSLGNRKFTSCGEATADNQYTTRSQLNSTVANYVQWNPGATGGNEAGASQIGVGTTAQRPATPREGDIRWDTDTNRLDLYRDAQWRQDIAVKNGAAPLQTFASTVRCQGTDAFPFEAFRDAATGDGPYIDSTREGITSAPIDGPGYRFRMEDDAGTMHSAAFFRAHLLDRLAASFSTRLDMFTRFAGSTTVKAHLGEGLYMAGQSDPGAGNMGAAALYGGGNRVQPHELRTKQASTSGTSIDFTGIRSDARRITVMFEGVSTTGGSEIQVQLGDSGGFETSGYLGATARLTSGAVTNYNSGFTTGGNQAAASVMHGAMTLTLMDPATNTWIAAFSGGRSNTNQALAGGGSKSLSGTLDQLRVTTVGGTESFDAGNINILIE